MQTTKAQHAIDSHEPQLDPKTCGEQMVQAGPKTPITVLDLFRGSSLRFRKERLSPVKFNTMISGTNRLPPTKQPVTHVVGVPAFLVPSMVIALWPLLQEVSSWKRCPQLR